MTFNNKRRGILDGRLPSGKTLGRHSMVFQSETTEEQAARQKIRKGLLNLLSAAG
jgi:hypothetical protein